MSDVVYVVEYSSGSYDDFSSWPVCWYPTLTEAEAHCANHNAALEAYEAIRREGPRSAWTRDFDLEQHRQARRTYWAPHRAVLEAILPYTIYALDTLLENPDDAFYEQHPARVVALPRGT